MMQNDNVIDIPSLQWYPGRIWKQGSRPLNFKGFRYFPSPIQAKCLPFVSRISRETNGRHIFYSTFFTLSEMICTGTSCISGRFSM